MIGYHFSAKMLPTRLRFAFTPIIVWAVFLVSASALATSAGRNARSLVPYITDFWPTGEPLSSMAVLAVSPDLRAPFQIEVRLGSRTGQPRVSHSMIWLNETPIIETADFESNVSTVKRNITLNAENNILRAEVTGPVGSTLWLSITGTPDREHFTMLSQMVWPAIEDTRRRIFSVHPYVIPPFEIVVVKPTLKSELLALPITIRLNGKQVLTPPDFQHEMMIVRREIDLFWENNRLEIELVKGAVIPTGFAVQVRGKRGPGFPGPSRFELLVPQPKR